MDLFDEISFEFSTLEELLPEQFIEASASGAVFDIGKLVVAAGKNVFESKFFADLIKYIVVALKSVDPQIAIDALKPLEEFLRKILADKETTEKIKQNVERAILFVKGKVRRNEILVIKDGQVTKESLKKKVEADAAQANELFGKSASAVMKWIDKRESQAMLTALETIETLLRTVTFSGTELVSALIIPNDATALQVSETVKEIFSGLFNVWLFIKDDISKGFSEALNKFINKLVGTLKNIKPADLLAFVLKPNKNSLEQLDNKKGKEEDKKEEEKKEEVVEEAKAEEKREGVNEKKEDVNETKVLPSTIVQIGSNLNQDIREEEEETVSININVQDLFKKLDVFDLLSNDTAKHSKDRSFSTLVNLAMREFRKVSSLLLSSSEVGREIEESLNNTIEKFLSGEGGKELQGQVTKLLRLSTSLSNSKKDEELAAELFGSSGSKILSKLKKTDPKEVVRNLAKLEKGYLKFASAGIKILLLFVPGWGWLASFVLGIIMDAYIVVGPLLNKAVRLAIISLVQNAFAFLRDQIKRISTLGSRLKLRDVSTLKDKKLEEQTIEKTLQEELEQRETKIKMGDSINARMTNKLPFGSALQFRSDAIDRVIVEMETRNAKLREHANALSKKLEGVHGTGYIQVADELAFCYVTLNDVTKLKSLHRSMLQKKERHHEHK